MLYFDYSATTPMSPAALETYEKVASDFFANSRSLHSHGEESEDVLTLSRAVIADALSVQANEIYFTGSGSEATFLAVTGMALANKKKGKTIITTRGEHHSVHQALTYLEKWGFKIRYVSVNEYGQVTKEALLSALTDDTVLVSIAHANSEIGTVQDIAGLGELLQSRGILFHSDCVQTFCKIPIPIDFVSSITVSAHKCYGPKGVGAAFIRESVPWVSFLEGTTHESGFRAGTVDVPGIASFAAAVDEYGPISTKEMERLIHLRHKFVAAFKENNRIFFEGHPTERLPFHIGLRVKGVEGQFMMLELKRKGISISTGSACRVGESEPPATLLSVGRTVNEAHEHVRITFGRWTTDEEVNRLLRAFEDTLTELKEWKSIDRQKENSW